MRVVLVNQYYEPDEAPTAVLLADLGRRLAREGHAVRVVCSRRSYTDPRQLYASNDRIGGVDVHRIWTTGFGRGSRLGRAADYATYMVGALFALLLQRAPDAIVSLTTPPMLSLVALWVARLKRASLVYWVMDIYPELAVRLGVLGRNSWLTSVLDRVSRYVLRGSTRVVTLGASMAAELHSSGARNVHVVHNWADGEAIRPVPVEQNELRRQWGWSERFVVLYSGNMGLAHDFDSVLDAAERLREHPEILFAFVGGGPRRQEVEQQVRQRDLPNVQFKPYIAQAELGSCLTSADVHLVTLREGLVGLLVPSKIYGILAAGRPTVYLGPESGEIAAMLEEGGCGTCIPLGDGPGLARQILAHASDSGRRLREGERARMLYEARYNKEISLRQLQSIIESVEPGHSP